MDKKQNLYICICLFITLFLCGLFPSVYSQYSSAAENVLGELRAIPMPNVNNAANSLIFYKPSNKSSVLQWASIIDGSLNEYRNKRIGRENRVACSFNSGPLGKQVCDVPLDDFSPCSSSNMYNYENAGPCVFLKLDNILNWVPEPYNNTNNLPDDMPLDIQQFIGIVSNKPEANTVWVSCKGEHPADEENIGPVQYIPRRGFPSYYYPFTNNEGYLSPLVAVLFEKPRKGVIINVECKAWAKNINDRYERRGTVHFKLMLECNCC